MTAAELPEFKGFLMQFIGKSDAETLDKLLHLFNDTCPFPETMYTLVHLVETWPCEIYIKSVLNHVSSLSSLAPFWLKTLVYTILNHKQGLVLFRQNMHLAPKEDLLKLFDLMEKESPHHKKLIEDLKRTLK